MPTLQELTTPHSIGDEVFSLSDSGKLSLSDLRGNRELIDVYRRLARSSLYFLAKAVLKYDKLTLHTHKPLCDFIQDLSIQRGLILLPRGVFKTTIGVIALSIWLLLQSKEHTILIANQIARHAERMLSEIEMHLGGSNPLMNLFFPEYIKPGDRHKPWNQIEMLIPGREMISGTPSIMTIGVGARSESIHTRFQLNDDLVGIEDMFSEMNMAAALTWHDYEQSLFIDPRTGIERMYGTRWPGNDLYKPLIASGEYKVYWKPVKNEETGELLFPEKYNDEDLRKAREKNWLMYRANIMNVEVHPGSIEFKKEKLRYFKLVDTDNGPACKTEDGKLYYCKDGDIVIAIDPAGSGDLEITEREEIKKQKVTLSKNAISVVMGHSDLFFQLEAWEGRAIGENPELQIAQKLLEKARAWQGYARTGIVEAYGAQAALITIFNMLCRQNNTSFPMKESPKGTKKSKRVRIRSVIGPAAENGQIYVRLNQDDFIDEFSSFPSSAMDGLDAFVLALNEIKMPGNELEVSIQRRVLTERSNRRSRFISRAGY